MRIILIKPEKLLKYNFPSDNISQYWIKDVDFNDNPRDLVLVEKIDNSWFIVSNENCYLDFNGKRLDKQELIVNYFYALKIIGENNTLSTAYIYVNEDNDSSYTSYSIVENGDYTIGKGEKDSIIIDNSFMTENMATLTKNDNGYYLKVNDNKFGVYVNNNKVISKRLETGDKLFITGYSFILLKDYIIISMKDENIKVNTTKIYKKELPKYSGQITETINDDNLYLYNENEYYSRQPRFVTTVLEENLKIDSPPGKQEQDDTPVIYTLGPMLTMTMTSAVSVSTSIANLTSGKSNISSTLPSLLIAVAMIVSTLLWPTLLKKFNKKKQIKNEEKRQKKYTEYLIEKRNKIESIKHNQHQILVENYPEPKYLQNIIINKKRNLWERQIDSEDFLNVRVGVGTIPLKINLSYSIEDFTMSEDNLKAELTSVTENAKEITNCPVTISLTERNKLVIIGETVHKFNMLKSIILQLATAHAYNDLKFVFMINDDSDTIWESFKLLPHVWSDSRDIRFYSNNYDDMLKLSFYLEQVFTSRKYSDEDGKQIERSISYKSVQPYYLLIVDNIKKVKNIDIVDKILKEEGNIGFGLLILNDGISNLPNEINDFLTVDGVNGAIIKNDLNKKNQQGFKCDNIDEVNMPLMCEKLSNIPIKTDTVLTELKNSVGFLEMYKVGRVEQLDLVNRWKESDPVNSLSVPIGIRSDGELFNLDLHEKFHGPHGLIAGMTGSGKSEFIITFILSMCINFSPEEVSFVLIDYKGGGLNDAFENKLTGIRLPHLAGTITNLDTAEIKRSLSSIQSELKRRQRLFGEVKEKLNESTLDIYKYQRLYREGVIDEPISHLFIISDEFAELKSQQPEFMSELISTARIGRSLGVHLILATQKPSGIVDDQIWSNSKFKVCLKVQERSDSMDVIRRPDAASLKKAGRFYLQVGYNDYFAIGQGAYAGTKYIPKDKITKVVDRDISFLNNIGDTIRNIETEERGKEISQGEELPAVLKYICQCAESEKLEAKKLWLDKIPAEIFITNLMRKYSYVPSTWNIEAIVGEYDDPSNQKQDLLKLDFNQEGNTLIYGSSGNEIMLTSIIYSLIINHSSEEINIYIIDFGSEMFGTFVNAPQVGDVVFINEQEKLANLFATITKELERRKKLFVDYNGSYNLYIKNSGKKLPRIMIIVNNYEMFTENYDDYVDVISSISRECEKFGIFFCISASGVSAVRGKTSQNFSTQLCLQFNNPSDYSSILGSTKGLIPSDIPGRGLVKLDGIIYEFQTAYPYKWDEINGFIRNICNQLQSKVPTKAKTIAILPTHVRMSDIKGSISDIKNTPIGIVKNTLEISTFNFNRSPITLISAQDMTMLDRFIPSLGEVFQSMNNVDFYMIDASESIKNPKVFKNYYSTNCDKGLIKLQDIMKNIESTKTSVFIIYGIESFMSMFNDEAQRNIKILFNRLKGSKNVRLIISDAVSKIKAYEYDDFYRSCVQATNAIWLGSGVTDQFTIKCSTYTKETRSQIPNDFGYNIDRGNATYIKLLDFYRED
ncbi:MAG: type VII secretion protein EssC [bacterium]|nr:type VII secretion protein EssC [bacterium]